MHFDKSDPARSALAFLPVIHGMQDAISAIEKCRQPVIAAVHGACIGAGLDLITACDIRFCSKDALFCVKEVDLAITADLGVFQRLPKLIGNVGWIKEVALTGRPFSSQEAFKQGLINQVFDSPDALLGFLSLYSSLEGAFPLARTIAEKAPVAVVGIKCFYSLN